MPASNTDYLIRGARKFATTVGVGGVADASVTTIPLTTVINLATDTAVMLVIDRVDANGLKTPALEEVVVGVVSGSSISNCIRGVEGTAQAHSAGAIVEVKLFHSHWDKLITHLLTEHNQNGTHNAALVAMLAGAQTFTGTKTFDAAPKFTFGTEASGDVFYGGADGTINRLAKGADGQVLTLASGVPSWASSSSATDGWIAGETWTYASATTFTVSSDVTAKYSKGTRVKLTQTTVKYFVVTNSSHSSGTTTVTVTGGTDYSLANAAISDNYYSYSVNPQGYPDYFNFTTTYTGFSSNPTGGSVKFAVIGKTCFLQLGSETGNGTSNSTGKSYTIPIPASAAITTIIPIIDNGSQAYGKHATGVSSSSITCYPGVSTANWTASGGCRLWPDGAVINYQI